MIRKKLKTKWKVIFVISFLFVTCLLYSIFIGSRGFNIKEYKVINKSLDNSFYGLKIVHFSDLYYGKIIEEKELSKIVNNINVTKPDIVVFSGDLIDKDTAYTSEIEEILIKYLLKIESTYGNYYVNGDNDKSINKLMDSSNFIAINNICETITNKENKYIYLCGFDTKINNTDFIDELKNNYKILVMHYPDYYEKIKDYNFNLVLSGHSYNGQFRLPFINGILRKKNSKTYYNEYYKISNTDLYISNGLSTDNINLRTFNKPSFNLYRLVDK